jgi:hypothetical protein
MKCSTSLGDRTVRRIRMENPKFKAVVGNNPGGMAFLSSMGFSIEDQMLVLTREDMDVLQQGLKLLQMEADALEIDPLRRPTGIQDEEKKEVNAEDDLIQRRCPQESLRLQSRTKGHSPVVAFDPFTPMITRMQVYIYIYIYIYVCVFICMYIYLHAWPLLEQEQQKWYRSKDNVLCMYRCDSFLMHHIYIY